MATIIDRDTIDPNLALRDELQNRFSTVRRLFAEKNI